MGRLSEDDEQQAQSIACTHLVRGCEGAVTDLALGTWEASERSAITQRAHDILAQVLVSWREASEGLRGAVPPEPPAAAGNDLDGWTSDELFAAAVARRADDVSGLRLMQGALLRALLTAHDAASSRSAQAKLVLA